MPITGTAPILTAQIKADLLLADPVSFLDNDALETLISTICTRVILHLTANGLVTVTVTVATTGTALAQAGGGGGTGTLT